MWPLVVALRSEADRAVWSICQFLVYFILVSLKRKKLHFFRQMKIPYLAWHISDPQETKLWLRMSPGPTFSFPSLNLLSYFFLAWEDLSIKSWSISSFTGFLTILSLRTYWCTIHYPLPSESLFSSFVFQFWILSFNMVSVSHICLPN